VGHNIATTMVNILLTGAGPGGKLPQIWPIGPGGYHTAAAGWYY
jgi:hypothetical protein